MTPEQLRASILQQAMEGKLVEQDPNDEPASVLLEKIAEEKARLIREKKIKRTKKLPEITDDEKPFEIPDSWEWAYVQDYSLVITDYVANGSFKTLRENTHKTKIDGYALFVRTQDLSNNFSTKIFIDKASYDFLDKSKLFGGEVILPNIGGSIGKVFRIPNMDIPMSLAPNSVMLKFMNMTTNRFFEFFIKSAYGKQLLDTIKGGSATPKFSKTELRESLLPVPPLAEQKRIVTKLDQLMSLVDEYAEAYDKLKKLDDGFNDKLKQSLLQYAMEGKLVKQDPNDEPASVLLEKIAEEKARLIREKKIKRTKKLPEITDDEKPFAIPDSWEWAYLSDVANITKLAGFEYTKYIKPNLKDNGIPLFKAKNIHNGEINYQFENFITEEQSDNLIRSQLNKKCLLTPYVGSIGNVAIFPGTFKAHLGSNVGKIELLGFNKLSLLEEFVMEYLKSPQGYIQLTKHLKSTAQPSISITALREVILPIPPLVEQKRIVAKIDQLMATIH